MAACGADALAFEDPSTTDAKWPLQWNNLSDTTVAQEAAHASAVYASWWKQEIKESVTDVRSDSQFLAPD